MKKIAVCFAAAVFLLLITPFAAQALEPVSISHFVRGVYLKSDSAGFNNISTLPTPAQGMDFSSELNKRIVYPQKAIDAGIEGEVVVLCSIDKEGNVQDVKILKDIGGDCALEVTRAVRTMKFNPAVQNGFPRPVSMTIPVVFDLASVK